MNIYTVAASRRNTTVAPSAPCGARAPIPEHIAAELRPDAREIWRRTRREPATCNVLASLWAGPVWER